MKNLAIVAFGLIAPGAATYPGQGMPRASQERLLCIQADRIHVLLNQLGQLRARNLPKSVMDSHVRQFIAPSSREFTALCREFSSRYGRKSLVDFARRNRFTDILP